MSELSVNTDAVVAAADSIKLFNAQIRDGLPSLQKAIAQLDNSWEGSASSVAISKFNEIISEFSDTRYNVLDNYANYLLQQVGEGYLQTEEENISLAEQFK